MMLSQCHFCFNCEKLTKFIRRSTVKENMHPVNFNVFAFEIFQFKFEVLMSGKISF